MEKPVRSSLQNLGTAYECALAIGNSLNLSEMLHEVIYTMVHKTNAHRGIIWIKNGEKKFQPVASAGINIEDVPAQGEITDHHDILDQIQKRQQFVLRYKDDKDFLQYCPVLTKKEECVLIVPVTNVAILHLVYASREIADESLANLLTSLSKRLSVSIEACIAHKNIINEVHVRVEAEEELKKKTDQLIFSEKELQRLYGESEQARKSLLSILEDVTQKEEALKESEEKFRTLFDSSRDAIMMETPEMGFTSGNPAAVEMFGCKDIEEFISQTAASLSPEYQPDGILSAEKAQQNINKALKEGSYYLEWVHKRLDGHEFPATVLLTSMELQGERILQATVRDITERKRIEQAIILMSDTQKQIAHQDKLMDIYQLVGKKIQELIGDGYVITTMYDEQIEAMRVIGVNGFGDRYENMVRKLKYNPFKLSYELKDMPDNHLRLFSSGKLEKYEGGLYNLLTRKVPKQICKIIEKEFNITDIYVIGFTWHDLDSGGVTILPKDDITPFKDMIETIMNQAAIAIKRIRAEEELRKSEQKLRITLNGTIHTIAATVEARDPYTAGHQTRVADLSAAIAREMSLSDEQVEGIKMAGIIHDLGKIRVPAEILSKPGKLSKLEFNLIKTHPQVGFDLIKTIEFPWPIAQMVLQHHEMMNGSGYPQGLKGDEILLEAKILAVADVVEAMSSHRPYRPALGIEKALEQIRQDKGTLLDPDVVDACLKVFKQGYKLPEE